MKPEYYIVFNKSIHDNIVPNVKYKISKIDEKYYYACGIKIDKNNENINCVKEIEYIN